MASIYMNPVLSGNFLWEFYCRIVNKFVAVGYNLFLACRWKYLTCPKGSVRYILLALIASKRMRTHKLSQEIP